MYNNKIGIIFSMERLLEEGVDQLLELGIETIQLNTYNSDLFTQENADKILAMTKDRIPVTSLWCGWSGPAKWNLFEGPETLGLVPSKYRKARLKDLKKGVDFCVMLGIKDIATHVGFIPEEPSLPGYKGVVKAIKDIVSYCDKKGIYFNFETGQETPVTLMRLIEDAKFTNFGINLDPANLIRYGRANPIDALGIYGNYIRGVHIKDAEYATHDFNNLGPEVVVGEGQVNFPVFLPKVLKSGYTGDLYIEREISGDQQIEDIKKTIKYVREIIASVKD